jgi:hypothetical protein
MPAWGWVVIAVVAAAIVAAAVWQAMTRRRTARLQQQFGPEYDRVTDRAERRSDAEAELAAREERRRKLDIRPLSAASRERYVETWQSVQAQFVDDPRGAVAAADSLIQSVMEERGYPVEDFEQRAADVSVDHPRVVENYRAGHRLAQATADAHGGSTEDLRQAMRHYRALFEELVDAGADEPLARDVGTHDAPAERSVRP